MLVRYTGPAASKVCSDRRRARWPDAVSNPPRTGHPGQRRLQEKRMDCYWITLGEVMDFAQHRADFLVRLCHRVDTAPRSSQCSTITHHTP